MQHVRSRDIYGKEYSVPLHELAWRPAAYGIIIRSDAVLLMDINGGYHMPGGGVDIGETPEDAVIREIKEETGLIARDPRIIGMLSTFFTNAHRGSAQPPAHVQSLSLYFYCEASEGPFSTEGHELDEKEYGLTPRWVPIKELDTIKVGSTVDWRPIVKQAASL
jgi:8-oxo-dGTP diphosphatase